MKGQGAKRMARWAVWAGIWVGLGLSGCSGKGFERNPNLHLVVKHERVYLTESAWTVTGRVFYLESISLDLGSGKLWSINYDGTDDRCLDPDRYYKSIDASRVGDTLVVIKSGGVLGPDILMLMDSDGNVLRHIPTGIKKLEYARLNWNETHIYFSSHSADPPGIYRVEIDSLYTLEFVYDTPFVSGFDVGYGDTLIFMINARINPTDSNYVAGAAESFMSPDAAIILMNITTGDSVLLDSVITPYEYNYLAGYCYPNWSPDGQQLIFSVGPNDGAEGGWTVPFEIWRLENVWEYIPQK